MTDEQRAALVEQIARICEPEGFHHSAWAEPYHRRRGMAKATAILAAIEPAIRADERARVVEEATTDMAVSRAMWAYCSGAPTLAQDTRNAIRAALGVEP